MLSMAALLFTSCTEDKIEPESGETKILSLVFNDNITATIDAAAFKATVSQPEGTDVSSMKVSKLTLSEKASANVKVGDIMNLTSERTITVTNGSAKQDWKVSVTFTEPEGPVTPDDPNEPGTPDDPNEPGTPDDPNEPGTPDDPNEPVDPEVPATDVAFVSILQEVELQGEALAAWTWAKENIENIRFINLWDLNADAVTLEGVKVLWCHYDFLDWPGIVWDTKDKLRTFWEKGGAMFLTRDGSRYINDVYEVSKEKLDPNNIWGGDGEGFDVGEGNGGFACLSYDHEIYEGLEKNGDNNVIYLKSQGCHCSNRVLQWLVTADWRKYGEGTVADWASITGGTALASNQDGAADVIQIAEFAPRTKLEGYTTGKVITIGNPYFEFMYNEENTYKENLYKLALNSINYLCK